MTNARSMCIFFFDLLITSTERIQNIQENNSFKNKKKLSFLAVFLFYYMQRHKNKNGGKYFTVVVVFHAPATNGDSRPRREISRFSSQDITSCVAVFFLCL